MKPNQTLPILATLAPAAAAAPPVLFGLAIIGGILWLLSRVEEEAEQTPAPHEPPPAHAPPIIDNTPAIPANPVQRRITREDLAEALEYGGRALTRPEAVYALQTVGFQKTAAYKALSPNGKFGELLEHTPDGLITWQG